MAKSKDKELSPRQSMKMVKELIFHKSKSLTSSDLKPGALLMYKYDAKDKTQVYDRTPFVLVLSASNGYVLGLNFHWLPYNMRATLVKLIIKMNKKNIANGKPIDLNYKKLKPLLSKFGYAPVIRLYIKKRISKKGVIIPESELLNAAKIKSETFTKGRASAAQLYAKAKKKLKKVFKW